MILEFHPKLPTVEQQHQIREMLIIQTFMEKHEHDPIIFVGLACDTIRLALEHEFSAEQAIKFGEDRIAIEKLNRKLCTRIWKF